MFQDKEWALIRRFARVFVSGALGNMAIIVAATQAPQVVGELGPWLFSLAAAAIAGGIAALDKAYRWEE
jgi:hypothetical protein